MRYLLIVIALGTTACSPRAIDSAVCAGLDRPVSDLRSALLGNPQTPQAVGEAGTDVVIGFEAGCVQ